MNETFYKGAIRNLAFFAILTFFVSGLAQNSINSQTALNGAASTSGVQPANIRPGVVVYRNLDYAGNGDPHQMLDLYIPSNATASLPVVVWIHGGGWITGNKEDPFDEPFYTSHGYAVASINYRFSDQAIFPAQIFDCKGAIRYLRAHSRKYNLDSTRIGVWGGSAGGHLVALLDTTADCPELEGAVGGNLDQSSRVQVVVDLYGPTDFLLPDAPKDLENLLAKLVGGPLQEHQALAREASPITYVTKSAAPIFIVHGEDDPVVPIQHSEVFYKRLKNAGVDTTLIRIPHAVHGGPEFSTPPMRKAYEDFFEKYLRPSHS